MGRNPVIALDSLTIFKINRGKTHEKGKSSLWKGGWDLPFCLILSNTDIISYYLFIIIDLSIDIN